MSKLQRTAISKFLGLNTADDPARLGKGWLQQADNVIITDTGAVERRDGYSLALSATPRGAYTMADFSRMYLVNDTSLVQVMPDMTTRVLATGYARRPMYFVEVNNEVFFTNGVNSGRIMADGRVLPWGWTIPQEPTLEAASGTMPAGMYRVICSFLLADGRETGTSREARITLDDNQALRITNIPQMAGARTAVYIAAANSTVFRRAFDTTLPAATWNGGANSLSVEAATQFAMPLPRDAILPAAFEGRVYVASFDAARNVSTLWASEPLAWHLFKPQKSFLQVVGRAGVLTSTDEGLVIGTDETIMRWTGEKMEQLADYGVVPGYNVATDSETGDTYTWTQRGVCRLSPFQNLTEGHLRVPPGVQAGGCVIRSRGQSHFVVALQSGGEAFNPRSTP